MGGVTQVEQDPFGNLGDWGRVLGVLERLTHDGELEGCQPGLVRILRYKGNWRLREEVLTRVGTIQTPSDELVLQVLNIVADDNVYFDARILAAEALRQIMQNARRHFHGKTTGYIQQIIERLRRTMQPFAFDNALKRLHKDLSLLTM
jgi:hypothetical protein